MRELESSGLLLLTRNQAIKVDLLDKDSALYQKLKVHSNTKSAKELAAETGSIAAIMRSSNMDFDKKQAEVRIRNKYKIMILVMSPN